LLKQDPARSDLLSFSYSRKAKSFFSRHEDVQREFEQNIDKFYLKGQSEGIDIKRTSGSNRWIRMRMASYRVIYSIIKDRIIIVEVMLAGNRGEIYKQYNKR